MTNDAERAFSELVAPFRERAVERVRNGTSRPPSDLALTPITSGTLVTHEPVEDAAGFPLGLEERRESLGFSAAVDE